MEETKQLIAERMGQAHITKTCAKALRDSCEEVQQLIEDNKPEQAIATLRTVCQLYDSLVK